MNTRLVLYALVLFVMIANPALAAQSTITEADGSACMGDDRSRKQTEQAALADAKKRAVEFVSTYLKSETEVKNFVLEKDLLSAYAHAEVKIIQELEKSWYKDPSSGDCCKLKIKAEVVPDAGAMERMSTANAAAFDDPSAPLSARVWTDKKEYKAGEKVKVYLKANKPFYGRLVYKDASGALIQLLPNPRRGDNYFNGGTVYEVPSGNDRFDLEVNPPFGEENVLLYASTAPLGEIDTKTRGNAYLVTTKLKDLSVKTRGIRLVQADGKARPSEFAESGAAVKTAK
jgi:hypothetical protein